MAFIRKNFGPIGGQSRRGIGGVPSVWAYKTADLHATVDTTGYFNAVRSLLEIGDLIYVVVVTNLDASNETLSTAGFHVLKDKSLTVVDVADVLALTMIDTD